MNSHEEEQGVPYGKAGDARPARDTDEDVKASTAYADGFRDEAPAIRVLIRVAYLDGMHHERGKSRPAAAGEGDAEVAAPELLAELALTESCARTIKESDPIRSKALLGHVDRMRRGLTGLSDALASSRQARRAAEAKVAVAEAWGMKFGLMKSNDRPEPYWLADVREGSDLDKMQQAVTDLIVIDSENTSLACRADAAEAEATRLREACKLALPEICCLYDQLPTGAKSKGEQTIGELIESRPATSVARAVLAARAALAADRAEGAPQ